MIGGSVETIGQIWLWRLEAKIVAAIVAGVLGLLWLLVYCLAGAEVAETLEEIGLGALFLSVPGCLIWAVVRVICPGGRDRETDRAMARYDALVEARFKG